MTDVDPSLREGWDRRALPALAWALLHRVAIGHHQKLESLSPLHSAELRRDASLLQTKQRFKQSLNLFFAYMQQRGKMKHFSKKCLQSLTNHICRTVSTH